MAWGLIALAIGVRAAAVLVLQSHLTPHSTYEHGTIAANLLAGRGFSIRFLGAEGPTSQQAPAYPFLVAAAYAVGGVETPRALLILELSQAVLGGVLVASVIWLAREVLPGRPRIALLAGAVAALHPTLIYAATHVQVALLAATLLTTTLACAFRTGRTGQPRDAAFTGLALAALALTDPILGLALAGVVWAVLLGRGGIRPAFRLLLTIGLTALLGVTPWIARNARVHGELVLIKSTFGYAFWQGNCALSSGTDKVVRASVERTLQRPSGGLRGLNESLWAARHEAGYLDDIALTREDYRELASVSEPERSRRLFRRALSDLRAEPCRYPKLCLRRLGYFVFFDETNPKTRSVLYRVSHLGLTLAAALGLVLAPAEVRRRLGPTVITVGLVAFFHAATIVSVRFHIPIEPLMAVWAASGVARLGSAAHARNVVGVLVDGRLGEVRSDIPLRGRLAAGEA